jgi:hypothetical protein
MNEHRLLPVHRVQPQVAVLLGKRLKREHERRPANQGQMG